jgi:hypothetical protein
MNIALLGGSSILERIVYVNSAIVRSKGAKYFFLSSGGRFFSNRAISTTMGMRSGNFERTIRLSATRLSKGN